ncbi:unnamed protein product [Symbiodinium microadriaticum]|nr:unnamed protein product [Symbiodinium microadriaticum]
MLRELALSQKLLLPGQQPPAIEDENVEIAASSKLKYSFLGLHVCKQGLPILLGVGWNPRLSTILKSVLEGRRSAPVDRRFMERPMHDARPVYSEVVSHLQTLYESVAETLPFEQPGEDEEEPDEYDARPASGPELRYLPPGSVYDLWRQYQATSKPGCSWQCFHSAWKEFKHKLTFRNKYTFGICPTCVKHKLMLRQLGHDAVGRLRQRALYDRHLASQFADRKAYWTMRASSRVHLKTITLIIDAIDQAKFATPRSPVFSDHLFQQFARPRLHVYGILVHGFGAYLAVMDADVSKGGSTTTDLLYFVLARLKKRGLALEEFEVNLQLDNTASSNKNNTMLAAAASLTFFGLAKVVRLTFLRVGHTHEDIDQWLGELASFIRRKVPICETPDCLIRVLNSEFMPRTRCKQWMADSAYSCRLVYMTKEDMQKLPGPIPAGFLPRRPAPQKYVKMIHGLASAITTPPFSLTRGAAYLRGWVDGTATKIQPLDCLELKSSTAAASSARPAAAGVAMSLEPQQSEVRVTSGNEAQPEQPGSMKMMVINEMASALHNNGSTWLHAIRESYRMFEQLPLQLQAKLSSQAVMCDSEKDDADVPLEAEFEDSSRFLPAVRKLFVDLLGVEGFVHWRDHQGEMLREVFQTYWVHGDLTELHASNIRTFIDLLTSLRVMPHDSLDGRMIETALPRRQIDRNLQEDFYLKTPENRQRMLLHLDIIGVVLDHCTEPRPRPLDLRPLRDFLLQAQHRLHALD